MFNFFSPDGGCGWNKNQFLKYGLVVTQYQVKFTYKNFSFL